MVSRFSISTALVQSKSSSGKKKIPTSFPWEPSYFYLPQQPSYSTLSFQFSHIFSLCIRSMIQWNLISSAHCHKLLSGTKLSLKFNLKQNEKEKNHKWESGPQPILWAPFSQGLWSYFASSSKPKLWAGAIAPFVAKGEIFNKNKTSFQAHQSVNVNCLFG